MEYCTVLYCTVYIFLCCRHLVQVMHVFIHRFPSDPCRVDREAWRAWRGFWKDQIRNRLHCTFFLRKTKEREKRERKKELDGARV